MRFFPNSIYLLYGTILSTLSAWRWVYRYILICRLAVSQPSLIPSSLSNSGINTITSYYYFSTRYPLCSSTSDSVLTSFYLFSRYFFQWGLGRGPPHHLGKARLQTRHGFQVNNQRRDTLPPTPGPQEDRMQEGGGSCMSVVFLWACPPIGFEWMIWGLHPWRYYLKL